MAAPFTPEHFRASVTRESRFEYMLYLPEGGAEPLPFMLFLHGSGERGEDIQKVAAHGPLKEVAGGRKFPFIIAAPQCPEFESWDLEGLAAMLDMYAEDPRVDRNRIYVTGLSMGGFAAFGLCTLRPNLIAAAVPICGAWRVSDADKMTDVPIWAIHGTKDLSVPFEAGKATVDAIQNAGGDAKLTPIKDAGHDVWTDAYAGDDVYAWMLAKRKGQ